MFVSSCTPCRHARAAGYDGCPRHNAARVRYTAPVVVEHVHHHAPAVVVVDDYDAPGSLFVDSSGHLSENLGGGIGVDLVDGNITIEGIDTGIDW